jgi:ComF family protein
MQLVSLLIDALFPPRTTERLVRTLSYESLMERIAPTTLSVSRTSVTALLPYHDPVVAACIQEAKYYGNQKAQELLGQVFDEYVQEFVMDERTFGAHDVVFVPIPLSRKRYKERGYNQTERIIGYADVHLSRSTLVRVKETLPQTTLGKQARTENMHDAFQARAHHKDTTYVVVDDVVTTGSTLGAAHEALTRIGAKNVRLIALAYQM